VSAARQVELPSCSSSSYRPAIRRVRMPVLYRSGADANRV
jgi:hypothetical protein